MPADRATSARYRSGTTGSSPTVSLPRPDGHGTVLTFTGIHPAGTLGVVHLLANDLAEIHTQAAGKPFSALVQVSYDPATSEPTQVELGTPILRPHDT